MTLHAKPISRVYDANTDTWLTGKPDYSGSPFNERGYKGKKTQLMKKYYY